ncbi:lipoprotein [Haloferula helveola]|uniref:Lipoprotein n=1 Tax=Haloferula helveola TaxID=490095 RepID=A0ABM7RJY8_9BACT|nr:lipoprotein [Haloferula helveola]
MTTLPDLTEHLHVGGRFCYPDWEAIGEIIEEKLPESERSDAWMDVSHQWVNRIRSGLGGGYQVHETPNFLLVTEAPDHVVRGAKEFLEEALKRILGSLHGVTSDDGYGKHVVFIFGKLADYYDYIDPFYPDGEHPMSGGVCLSGAGYVHFALPATDYSSYRTVFVHELTHACVTHLPIPTWLNEALAMRMEEWVCGTQVFHLDAEMYGKHEDHWNEHTIQQFWTGESWNLQGDSFELSYNLAQVLWRKIEVDIGPPREVLLEFAAKADWEDAGEGAFRALFDLSLGELVADFLGEGPWAPDPTMWPEPGQAQTKTASSRLPGGLALSRTSTVS